MVWIHGGAFTTGSNKSDLYGPDYLMTQDIVLVTINYRLGILGKSKCSFWVRKRQSALVFP